MDCVKRHSISIHTVHLQKNPHRAGLETPDGGGGWLGHPGQGESGGSDAGEGRHGAGLGGLGGLK